MSVEFEEADYTPRKRPQKKTYIIDGLKKTGLVKTDAQANIVLLLIALASFALAIYIIYVTFFPNLFDSPAPAPQPEDLPAEINQPAPADTTAETEA